MSETLSGNSIYPGNIKGKAIVIEDPDNYDLNDVLNKINKGANILVVESTNPDLLTIMLKCKGIIAVNGGLLCHTAIVAREFKLPTIIGVKDALSKIKDGDFVSFTESGTINVDN